MPNADSSMKVVDVPLDQIFHDVSFGCRGFILHDDVAWLVADILKRGLREPIRLQPWTGAEGKLYRILDGHRRAAAVRYIRDHHDGPATIRAYIEQPSTETEALALKLGRNHKRERPKYMQEARLIQKYKDESVSQSETARELGVSRSWVQIRYYVLGLPAEIQDEIVAGFLNHKQIHQLNGMTREDQYEEVRRIKEDLIEKAKMKEAKKKAKDGTNPRKRRPTKPDDLRKSEDGSSPGSPDRAIS
jgi:ParB/RepB/Spo0J family partition protein